MLSSPVFLALLYLGAALVFSVAYYIAWQMNSDSFIVHQEMNLRPLALWRRLRNQSRTGHPKTPQAKDTLEKVNEEYVKLEQQEQQQQQELLEIEPKLKAAAEDVTRLAELHNKEWAKKVQDLLQQQQAAIDAAIANMKKDIQNNPNDIEGADRRATSAIRAATEGQDWSPNAIFSKAGATSHLAALDNALRVRDDLTSKQIETNDKLRETRVALRTLLETWDKERLARLTYFDFLYFSMGVATSNTFGDIIPNDRVVRFVIVVQLLLSLTLVGLFINAVS